MFDKKKKVENPTGSDIVFQRSEIDFYDFRTYCCNFTTNGDWIIPLSSEEATKRKYEDGFHGENSKNLMETFDSGLLSVYRHQDDKLVRKNIRMLGDRSDPDKKGLYYSVLMAIDKADRIIAKLPKKGLVTVCDFIRKLYDDNMKDPVTGQQIETHIWIPVWKATSEKAILISLLGRVNLVIT